ncbi:MAG: 50S ribosomal protein L10 [Alphaproteobacteria bacterium]|nr:50S ribosomal protein L10 [Alphaproteobacteria bacterium]MBL0717786.1 50S ribosomal protein L10 [Alphaproteobacteria bacterium]
MKRIQKKSWIESMHQNLLDSQNVFVVSCQKMPVKTIDTLRANLRKVNASFKVTRNKLMKLALKDTKFGGVEHLFSGTTATILKAEDDAITVSRIIVEFAKANPEFQITGGATVDDNLSYDDIVAFSKLKTLDESRANIVGIINAPASKLARVLAVHSKQ